MTIARKPSLTEAQWRGQVIYLAAAYRWRVFMVENSTREIVRRSGARVRIRNINPQGVGFPDLVLCRAKDRRIIFAELKKDLGPRGGVGSADVKPEQNEWLNDLRAVADGVMGFESEGRMDIYVWRPADYDEVEAILR